MAMKVVEVCTVAPLPGSTVPTSLELTFFDILWLRFPPPTQCLYFYKSSAPFDVVVSNLKTTLSLVLQHYLPLAGAIVWPENAPKPIVETVANDGIVFTVAECNSDFDKLVGDGLRNAAEFHPLVPELVVTESRAAVVALQVTSFGTHGFCIGITSNHAILDGKSATSFVKLWARVCKSLVVSTGSTWDPVFPEAEMMPFYDRSVITGPAGLEDVYLKNWLALGGPNNKSLKFLVQTIQNDNLFRGTFKLNPQTIQKLKQFIINNQNPRTQPRNHISTFTVAIAYTWVCAAIADNSFHNNNNNNADEIIFCVSADVRQRLDPPVPTNYFGNCIVDRITSIERAKLVGENGMLNAVESISKAIKSLEEDGVLKGAEKWVTDLTEALDRNNEKVFSIAGSPRFEMYGMDFGWGTPVKVEIVSIDGTEAVSVCDGRDGGVELGWVADRDFMDTFAALFAKGLQQL